MKVVVAIDSFKGSMSSMEAGNACKRGILKVFPNAEVEVKPLADGGEGTTEAFVEGMNGQWIETEATNPMGESIRVSYGYLPQQQTAVIEMAAAAGIVLVPEDRRDVRRATTYGVGEMIRDAIDRGCRKFIVGIGGSATNDCGIGMLTALGVRFLDENGTPVGIGGEATGMVSRIDTKGMLPELLECEFLVACDVTNPLCGRNGATYIYGPQKGVTADMREEFDQYHKNFADCTAKVNGTDFCTAKGAGAAGGLGFAFLSYLNGKLQPGIQLVMEAIGLEECLKQADYVITGEGQLDGQTAMGKVPIGVARLAKQYGAKVIAVAGSISKDALRCNQEGIDAYFSILPGIMTLEEAMNSETAKRNMESAVEQIFRLIR